MWKGHACIQPPLEVSRQRKGYHPGLSINCPLAKRAAQGHHRAQRIDRCTAGNTLEPETGTHWRGLHFHNGDEKATGFKRWHPYLYRGNFQMRRLPSCAIDYPFSYAQ